ncbi:MAG: cation acetate symporter, partial [Actinomycetota bacterium]|nr:cation acetate symporter [Actinomycetota bacterium]
FLVALAFAVAASANVPVILLTIFWRRFNTAGAISGMIVGLVSSVGLVIASPVILGDAAIFPFERGSPALISVPLGFLACWLGTLLGGRGAEREREQGLQKDYDEVYVSSLTGIQDVEEEIQEAEPSR